MNYPRVLTFDCYGTLINWEKGILQALSPFLKPAAPEPEELLGLYARLEAEEERIFRPYKEILRAVAQRMAQSLGLDGRRLEWVFVESLPHWPVFADVAEVLPRLKERGFLLAIISNTDRDLLAASVRQMGVEFDWLITAEEARAYKPAPEIFTLALKRIGLPKEEIWHVAQSHYHDIVPVSRLGITTVWLNRRVGKNPYGATLPARGEPDILCQDLKELERFLIEQLSTA